MNLATNFLTKTAYTGDNEGSLTCHQIDNGFETNFWLTYKQAQSLGGQVRKGSKGFKCHRVMEVKKEINGVEVKGKACRTFTVFNIAQIDGLAA